MSYSTRATFYGPLGGGSYTAGRVWTPGSTERATLWTGLVDFQDDPGHVERDRDGNVRHEYDGVLFPQERDEAEVLTLAEPGVAVVLDGYGEAEVTRTRRIDGTVFVRYLR